MIQFWWRSGSRFGSGRPKSEIWILRIGGGLCSLSISSCFLCFESRKRSIGRHSDHTPRLYPRARTWTARLTSGWTPSASSSASPLYQTSPFYRLHIQSSVHITHLISSHLISSHLTSSRFSTNLILFIQFAGYMFCV